MQGILTSLILFLIAIFAFVLSIRSFKCKGFLFNNAYLYASKQERENMHKEPYYHQSAVVFLLLGIVFALLGFAVLLPSVGLIYAAGAAALSTIMYAIASSVFIEMKKG